jgi:hypothetical protein
MDWQAVSLAVVQLVFMAFFCTSLVEVVKDLYEWLRKRTNGIANKFRATKITLTQEQLAISEAATKWFAFALGLWMCIALDYGVLHDIIQLGEDARKGQAAIVDYLATAAVLRLGAKGAFDAVSMLTTKMLAAKALAKQLTAPDVKATQ